MATIIDKSTISETASASVSLHLDTTLNITADQARRRVNVHVVSELATGLIGREAELVIVGDQLRWRVPIELSLPGLGTLGQVGTIEIDAQTGDILTSAEAQAAIIDHATLLYDGTTLRAE